MGCVTRRKREKLTFQCKAEEVWAGVKGQTVTAAAHPPPEQGAEVLGHLVQQWQEAADRGTHHHLAVQQQPVGTPLCAVPEPREGEASTHSV